MYCGLSDTRHTSCSSVVLFRVTDGTVFGSGVSMTIVERVVISLFVRILFFFCGLLNISCTSVGNSLNTCKLNRRFTVRESSLFIEKNTRFNLY